jgi:hypothetical protein
VREVIFEKAEKNDKDNNQWESLLQNLFPLILPRGQTVPAGKAHGGEHDE